MFQLFQRPTCPLLRDSSGRIYKLSPFVGTFMPEEKRNTSGAYQGAKYFSYKGKVLDDLRSIIESNIPLPESDVNKII